MDRSSALFATVTLAVMVWLAILTARLTDRLAALDERVAKLPPGAGGAGTGGADGTLGASEAAALIRQINQVVADTAAAQAALDAATPISGSGDTAGMTKQALAKIVTDELVRRDREKQVEIGRREGAKMSRMVTSSYFDGLSRTLKLDEKQAEQVKKILLDKIASCQAYVELNEAPSEDMNAWMNELYADTDRQIEAVLKEEQLPRYRKEKKGYLGGWMYRRWGEE